MHLDLNLLSTLSVLLQTRSVTVTAQRLKTSQPSVSRSLAELRHLLGDPLLVRSGNSMIRTRRGEDLLEPVAEWLSSATALIEPPRFDPARLERRFRIASTDFGVLAVIAPALSSLMAEAPGVAIDIVSLNQGNAAALAAGEVDIAVSGLPHDPAQLHDLPLFEDGFECVMRADHPLAGEGAGPLSIDDLMAWPHVGLTVGDAEVDRVAAMLGRLAEGRRVVVTLPYFGAAPDVLVASPMLMTIPRRAAKRFAARHGLVHRAAPVELGTLAYRLLWHERSDRDEARRWLCDRLAAYSSGA